VRETGHGSKPVVIFTAGLVSPEDRAALGNATIITKPFDLDEFLSTLRDRLLSQESAG
jgi:hypothetical protein